MAKRSKTQASETPDSHDMAKSPMTKPRRPAKPAATSRTVGKKALLVLGMHRSGTSAMAGVLNLLGAVVPKTLMPPNETNPLGFFESTELIGIHDELLASAGLAWDDIGIFSPDWYHSPAAEHFQRRLLAFLQDNFADSPLFVIKDPRACRFASLWLFALAEFKAEPHAVIIVRDPLEVAASLKARDGFVPGKSYLLWLRHVLDAERDTRGVSRSFVTYDRLLADWRRVAETLSEDLRIKWPRTSHRAVVEIDQLLVPRHRHHVFDEGELNARPEVVDWVKRAFATLLGMAERGETEEAQRTLGDIARELAQADLAFGPVVTAQKLALEDLGAGEERLSGERSASAGEIEGLRGELETAQGTIAERDKEVERFSGEISARNNEIGQMRGELCEAREDIVERDGRIRQLEYDLFVARATLAVRDISLQAMHASTSWRVTAPLRAIKRKAMHIYRSEGLAGIKRGFRAVAISSQAASDPGSLPATQVPEIPEVARAIDIDYSLNIPFTFTGSAPTDFASGQVAAIIHMFHEELASEFRSYLESIPPNFDIFISTTDTFRKGVIEKAFKGWSRGSIEVRIVPNRGRDIAPKLVNFRDVYDRYAYVLHLHSKSSHHDSVLASWRHFLLENLLGTSGVVLSVLEAFHCNPKLGIIASQHFEPVRHWVNWGDNFKMADGLARRMGISLDQNTPLDFPSGSMFWARSAALQPLLELELQTEDFDEEDGRVDGTLAAAIERMYFHVCERAGYDWIKVARPELFEYTPAIMTVRNTSDLDDFFARYVFRLLNPGGVKPRTVHPPPVERPANQLLDYLRNRALGVEREDGSTAKVVIGLLTYNNGGDELRLAVGAARLAVERSGLATKNSIFVLDNGASSEAITVGNAAVVRLASGGNIGYGAGHNRLMHAAFDAGADIYIAANPDGALHPDAVSSLVQTVQAHHGRALVEAVQFPVEVPKPYDPVTLATPWVSGVCLAIPRAAFKELCGFDESFFMYFGDVDLSWRARANGFALRTCPCAMFLHAVTNREQQPETLEMIFGAGITLARKWDSPDFEAWLRSELAALGAPVPDVRPAVVPEAWRRYADFSHHFSFAQARW